MFGQLLKKFLSNWFARLFHFGAITTSFRNSIDYRLLNGFRHFQQLAELIIKFDEFIMKNWLILVEIICSMINEHLLINK